MDGVNPIDALTVEHELVLRYVETLEAAARGLRRGERLPGVFFEHALAVAHGFVEDFHHVREEHHLFPRLLSRRRTELEDHVQVLGRQHQEGHRRIEAITGAVEDYLARTPGAREDLADQQLGYADLLRRHIHREDALFFPLARAELGEAESREVAEEFRQVEECFPPDYARRTVARVGEMRTILRDLPHTRRPATSGRAERVSDPRHSEGGRLEGDHQGDEGRARGPRRQPG